MTENEEIQELDAPFEVLSSCLPSEKACLRAYSDIITVTGGTALLSFGDDELLLKKGGMCIIRPFVPYSIKEVKGSAAEIRLDVHTLELPSPFICLLYRNFGERCDNDRPYTALYDTELQGIAEKIVNSFSKGYFSVYPQIIMLMSEISSRIPAEKTDVLLYHICEVLDAHSSEQTEATEIAALCGMSYPSFARKFHEHYGRSFKEHINYVRTVRARMLLLNTDMELTEIARSTGFFDCSHMIRTYRKYFGTTPNHERICRKCK